MSLGSPTKVQTLQRSLHVKAKEEPKYRFYSLWDKIHRNDVLTEAYRRSKANGGSPGVDGETFRQIETFGASKWLDHLAEELRQKAYKPQPLRRVWIPKSNGKLRPLGIPTIRCRVVQMAMTLVLEPIFEADFLPSQYGYRPGLDAKLAVRRIFFHATQFGRTEVVDADLKDYFGSIPHGDLLRCVARRIADGAVLDLIKSWLEAPVQDRGPIGRVKTTTDNRNNHRGTCQGGCISPLLANLYFRRFLLGWEKLKPPRLNSARIVSYADDFVICCKPGTADQARNLAEQIIGRIGLSINDEKTRVARLPDESFDFLGYTFGQLYRRGGSGYVGTKPSRKAISKVKDRIHQETARNMQWDTVEGRIRVINTILRGWGNYFDQGPVQRAYHEVNQYTCQRLQRWIARKHKATGSAKAKYPKRMLYGKLSLYNLPETRAHRPNAKA